MYCESTGKHRSSHTKCRIVGLTTSVEKVRPTSIVCGIAETTNYDKPTNSRGALLVTSTTHSSLPINCDLYKHSHFTQPPIGSVPENLPYL
jgi:hypothetical protein